MTTHVERSIEVAVPVRTAYDQWTRFEEFPQFMSGVQEVRQVGDALTHWVAHIAGVHREWDAEIIEQIPDQKVAWAATTGATNAGAVFFDDVGAGRTRVRLTLEFEPEGVVERLADVLDVVDRQAVADLDRFKEFIEGRGSATGGWRGTIEDGDVVADETNARTGMGGATPGRETANDVPGDVVAVGPTGGTESTLTTEHGGAPSATPSVDDSTLGHSGDPVAVDPPEAGGGRHGARSDEPWAAGGSGPGEDRGVRGAGQEGVVQRDFADESIRSDDVVARDFDNRDISGQGVVERDFANRDITERDIANRGIVDEGHRGAPAPQPTGLNTLDAPGPADGIGGGLDPLDPRAGTADDPDNPIRPSV